MGNICQTDKKMHNINKVGEQNQKASHTLPRSKYSLIQPQEIILEGIQTQVMIISEGLAYNFLVKQGVLIQKDVAVRGDAIFFYGSEEKDLALQYSQIGLVGISDGHNEILEDTKLAKVLFNLKSLWVFREKKYKDSWLSKFLLKLNSQQIKVKQINYFPIPLQNLVTKYNLLHKSQSVLKIIYVIQILKIYFPLQIFQSCDILNEQTQNNATKDDCFNIYLHGINHVTQMSQNAVNLYTQSLSIRSILFIFEKPESTLVDILQKQGYKVDILNLMDQTGQLNQDVLIKVFNPYLSNMKTTNSSLLLVHDNQNSQLAFSAVKDFLSRNQLIHLTDIQQYLDERKTVIIQGNAQVASQLQQNGKIQKEQQEIILSRCDELKIQFQQLQKASKSSIITSSLHQTILKLLENMIEFPQDPKYRSIQTSNKRIQLNVFQYKEGVEVLKICGFVPQPQDQPTAYINNLESGMLKLCRGDLEVAFKQSQEQQ